MPVCRRSPRLGLAVERAGGLSPRYEAQTALQRPKSRGSWIKQVHLTTSVKCEGYCSPQHPISYPGLANLRALPALRACYGFSNSRSGSSIRLIASLCSPKWSRANAEANSALRSCLRLPMSTELVEQRFGILEVSGVEALGEPAVDRGEEIVGLSAFALIAPQSGEARCCAQL